MFAVDHVLISDAVLDAPFACHFGQCLGACCVHGDHGAPLEPDERAKLEAALPIVKHKLRPEALRAIAREGVWTEEERGKYGTTTVGGRECVFVTYDKDVAKCSLQQAFTQVGWTSKSRFPVTSTQFALRLTVPATKPSRYSTTKRSISADRRFGTEGEASCSSQTSSARP